MNRIHRALLHPPLSRHSGSAAGRPAGVYYREAGRRMTFYRAHSPDGASLMNDTAAADAYPTKGGRPWRS
jgi:hypothetical protein